MVALPASPTNYDSHRHVTALPARTQQALMTRDAAEASHLARGNAAVNLQGCV